MTDVDLTIKYWRENARNPESNYPERFICLENAFNHAMNARETQKDELAKKDAEIARLTQYVKDSGSTFWACETCGRGRNAKGCLWCENVALKAEIDRL